MKKATRYTLNVINKYLLLLKMLCFSEDSAKIIFASTSIIKSVSDNKAGQINGSTLIPKRKAKV